MIAEVRRAVGRLCTGFVLLLAVLYFSPLVPLATEWLTGTWEAPKGDVLIVLGADQLGDGSLGVVSYWRALYAVRAWRAGGIQTIVVSGGRLGEPGQMSIAQAMADFMVGLGLPRDTIFREEKSTSTRENAIMTAKMIDGWPGTRVLLTSDIHMRRARAAFARAGVETIPAPIPDVGKRWNSLLQRWDCIWDVGFSLTKFGYYRLRGWV